MVDSTKGVSGDSSLGLPSWAQGRGGTLLAWARLPMAGSIATEAPSG